MATKPMISVAGIRGIVGESLRAEDFFRYALAFATLTGGGKVILGRDSRISGEMLWHVAVAALQSAGCVVIDLGLVPTPTVGMMITRLGASGGIAITASHNPGEWNAYKFFGAHGSFLDESAKDQLLQIEDSGEFRRAEFNQLGRLTDFSEALEIHVDKILTALNVEEIRARKFRVVVDCVNGVGRLIAEPLLQKLGCEVEFLYGEPTGNFPRNPEPLPENLVELGEAVLTSKADVGFAIDPDADRLAIVDEMGRPLGEERTLVLAARVALKSVFQNQTSSTKPVLVANLSSTRALDDVAKEFGAGISRTPIGEAWVVKEITDRGALIGGEGNGGVIYPTVHPGRDAATGIGLILQGMARSGKSVSQLNSRTPDYAMVKTKFPASAEIIAGLKDTMNAGFSDALDLITRDGVKAVYADRWVHVRPSGTEPVVRIFAEAPDKKAAKELVDRAQELFQAR